ncbi:outer membrane protein assembly factor BamB family protein [Paenibacillus lactis]|uniref:outer membrane protein assembly factor BamB family protein n=1 Tax=Paenibacillus lactis TaxID=228574 RepID=UPI001C930195
MIRTYKWIAVILFGIILSGCGNHNSKTNSENTVKALQGLSNVAWTFKAEQKATLSQPLVTDNNTYFGTDKTLYAVDTKTGTKKWTRPINGLPSVPALSGNTLIFTDNDGIQAVKADNGDEIWKYDYHIKDPSELKPNTVITSSSHAFIVEQSEDGRSSLKALEIKTGKLSWEFGDSVPLLNGFVLSADKLYVPMQGVVHIIDKKSGKETDSITLDVMISSINVTDDVLYVVDLGGYITAFDLKSKQQMWQYAIETFEAPNAPVLTVLKDKVISSEVKSGSMIGIDAQAGKELWKIKMGDEKYRPTFPWVITQPTVLEDTLYIGAWDGQNNEVKYMPEYSKLIALDGNTGKELWYYKVQDYIMYPPAFINGMAIVTNMQETITAFNEGQLPYKNEDEQTPVEEPNANNIQKSEKTENSLEETETREFIPKDFEGEWRSEKQSFKLALIDDAMGTLTFYDNSVVPFEYIMPDSDSLMLKIGSEQKAAVIILYDYDTLGYRDNNLQDTLKRQNNPNNSVNALISGFEGNWCNSLRSFCFKLELTDMNKGTLDYYQESEPFKDQFEITYMDEYSIDIKIEGVTLATLDLNSYKDILTYESDSVNETLKRQED